MDDADAHSGVGVGAKLIDLGTAVHEPAVAVGIAHEQMGQLAFQQLSLVEPSSDSAHSDAAHESFTIASSIVLASAASDTTS